MISYSQEILDAISEQKPIVALESTIITHGFPKPQNYEMACSVEIEIRNNGAIPATIAIIEGQIKVGLNQNELEMLAENNHVMKASTRELAECMTLNKSAGTTVASTMLIAARAGIKYFATGGIGGVHLDASYDVSHDLYALSKYPVAVISSGAKSILDIPRTLEYLETLGVPVISVASDSFTSFYSRGSEWPSPLNITDIETLATLTKHHFDIHQNQLGMLIANPIPEIHEIPYEIIQPQIKKAIADAQQKSISGKALTPFLLNKLNELTDGKTLESNTALIHHNAKLAAMLAVAANN